MAKSSFYFALAIVLALMSTASAQMHGGNFARGMGGMMLLSGGRPYRADGKMVQMQDAIQIAQQYMVSNRRSGLALDEIEEWEFNYYIVIKEASPSNYKAFQLIIDKWTGYIMPEPGANMMWNTKYAGMMTGGMGGGGGMGMDSAGAVITPAAAAKAANDFLAQRLNKGRTLVVSGAGDEFYGFFTFDVKDAKTGQKYGMLSVNATTAQVWYHTWHGRFIAQREL